jgi:hypothetical protein
LIDCLTVCVKNTLFGRKENRTNLCTNPVYSLLSFSCNAYWPAK